MSLMYRTTVSSPKTYSDFLLEPSAHRNVKNYCASSYSKKNYPLTSTNYTYSGRKNEYGRKLLDSSINLDCTSYPSRNFYHTRKLPDGPGPLDMHGKPLSNFTVSRFSPSSSFIHRDNCFKSYNASKDYTYTSPRTGYSTSTTYDSGSRRSRRATSMVNLSDIETRYRDFKVDSIGQRSTPGVRAVSQSRSFEKDESTHAYLSHQRTPSVDRQRTPSIDKGSHMDRKALDKITAKYKADLGKTGSTCDEIQHLKTLDKITAKYKADLGITGSTCDEIQQSSRYQDKHFDSLSASNYIGNRSSKYNTKHVPGTTGLRNIGTVCFMNSILQCLSKIKELKKYFQTSDYKVDLRKDTKYKGLIAEGFASMIKKMWSEENTVDTYSFYNVIKNLDITCIYREGDASEFFDSLAMALHTDLMRQTKSVENYTNDKDASKSWKDFWGNGSTISDIFGHQLKMSFSCTECANVQMRFWNSTHLFVHRPRTDTVELEFILDALMSGKAFKENSGVTPMNNEYTLSCPVCGKCSQHELKQKIQRFPKIVVICIQIALPDGSVTDTKVSYKPSLDLKKYATSKDYTSHEYKLIAVCYHPATHAHTGHYWADIKHPDENEWYHYDDSRVMPLKNGVLDVTKPNKRACILFYQSCA